MFSQDPLFIKLKIHIIVIFINCYQLKKIRKLFYNPIKPFLFNSTYNKLGKL